MIRNLLLILALVCSFRLIGQSIDTTTMRSAIERQLATYPESTLQDIYKSFYQEHFGPGHIISDTASARRYLMKELSEMGETQSPSFEPTGCQGDYVRVYLAAVSDSLITAKQLLDAFVRSANSWQEPAVSWMEKWEAIVSVIQANKMEIEGFENDLPLLNEAARNNQAVHHSHRYNEAYHPHYRIVEHEIFERELNPYITLSTLSSMAQITPKSQDSERLVRLAEIEVEPEYLEDYMAFAKEVGETSTRIEPGVLTLFSMQAKEDPCKIYILEIYADQEAYQSHIQTAHFKKYKEGTAQMVKSLKLVDVNPLAGTENIVK